MLLVGRDTENKWVKAAPKPSPRGGCTGLPAPWAGHLGQLGGLRWMPSLCPGTAVALMVFLELCHQVQKRLGSRCPSPWLSPPSLHMDERPPGTLEGPRWG